MRPESRAFAVAAAAATAVASGRTRRAWTPRPGPVGLSLEGRTLAWGQNRSGVGRVWTLALPR